MSNPIITENLNAGTTAWKFGTYATTQIQAYANLTSLDPGSTITFYVSTQSAGTTYTIAIYRLGWYNGTGGRLITALAGNTGIAQGYYDGTTLQSCPSALIDSATHLIDANWTATDSWAVPANAVSGVYMAIATDANGKQWGVSFVVRGNASADYVIVLPYTTDCAYNTWGGWSLYTNPTVGVKVSLNRPQGWGDAGQTNLYSHCIQMIHWLELQGYNVAYRSSVDLHTNAAELLTFKAYLSLGHDEYWSKPMRDGVEAAIAGKVSAAFMGANACFWQIRFENDAAGNANRTIVCYKVTTAGANLTNDPQYGVNTTFVTSNWRDAVLNRPEASMIGIMYSNTAGANPNVAWTTSASMDTTYTAGTGLAANTPYGSDIVGNEWDKQAASSPTQLKIIGATTTTPSGGGSDTSHTTTYKAASGALVFASGSIDWAHALDSFRLDATSVAVVPQMQVLMQNIMGALKGPVWRGF